MRPHYSPQRQGARYVLEERDIVILGSTPIFDDDRTSRDTRIRISQNGFAERALWVTMPKHVDEAGASTEFHLWTYKLHQKALTEIAEKLDVLARIGIESQADIGQRVRVLRFWHAGGQMEVSLHEPTGPSFTAEQVSLFNLAWEAIESAVPAGS